MFSNRLPVSTEALINCGQAQAFVLVGQKQCCMLKMPLSVWRSDIVFQSLESAALFLISLPVIWTEKEGKLKGKEGVN